MCGSCVVRVWYVCGTCVCGMCVVRVWYVCGACVVCVWYVCGACVVRVWYVFGVWYVRGSQLQSNPTCSSDPPLAKYSPQLEKAAAVAAPL